MKNGYIDGFEYHDEVFASYTHPQGRVAPGPDGINCEYFLRDHLGSVRVIYADIDRDRSVDFNEEECELLEEFHYYPFALPAGAFDENRSLSGLRWRRRGQEMTGMWNNMREDQYRNRHTYNGKPAQTEMGWDWLNYGARYYDPMVGRWNSVDPLAALMPSCSPYAYAFNSPLLYTDPSGMAPETIDPSRLTGSGLQALANMLATPEGRASLATFAKEGETLLFSANGKTVSHTFTEGGSRAKDNLVLASSDAFVAAQGVSRAYTDDSWSTQLKDASPNTDISGGVALLVQIDSRLGEESATHTLMHEMEVHANQDAVRLNHIDFGVKNGSLKVGSDNYARKLSAVGNSKVADHSNLSQGKLLRYDSMSSNMDRIKGSSIYCKMYLNDVRIHQ